MALLSNLLYPPLVDTAMDSFIRTEPCVIYFDLNDYNSIDEVKAVQVIVSKQRDGGYALDETYYPGHIKECAIQVSDNTAKGDYMVKIYPADVGLPIVHDVGDSRQSTGGFPIDMYYRVQLRLVGINCNYEDVTTKYVYREKDSTDKDYSATINGYSNCEEVYYLTDNILSDYKAYYSEWSTACIFRGINIPTVNITDQNTTQGSMSNRIRYRQTVVDVRGELGWIDAVTGETLEDNTQYETLQMYRIKVFNVVNSTDILIVDSNWMYPTEEDSSKQQLYYSIPHNFVRDETYRIDVDIQTSYGYSPSTIKLEKFQILPIELEEELTDFNFSAVCNDEEGYVHLKVEGTFSGNLCIRRSSSESQFTEWVDLKYIPLFAETNQLNYEFNDTTVKSGVFYKYGVQRITYKKIRGELQEIGSDTLGIYNILPNFEHAYLTTGGRQLKIKYDKQISDFSRVVNESSTETLGSKYPYIRRNSNVDYKQFSISGIISYQSDEKHLLVSKNDLLRQIGTTITSIQTADHDHSAWNMKANGVVSTTDSLGTNTVDSEYDTSSIYGEYTTELNNSTLQQIKSNIASSYKQYNDDHRIPDMYDFTLEREFRECVMDFLYEDSVKLFKSAAEGNMLVKLTDITLEPKEEVGGLVYSFSATASEVAEFTLDNCRTYGIQTLGSLVDHITTAGTAIGQLYRVGTTGENLGEEIKQIQEHSIITHSSIYDYEVDHIKWMRMEFQSDPYFVNISQLNSKSMTNLTSDTYVPGYFYGYVFSITLLPNSQQGASERWIFVQPDGRFDLIDSGSENFTTEVFECTIYNTYINGKSLYDNAYEEVSDAIDKDESVKNTEAIAIAEENLALLDIYEDLNIQGIKLLHDDTVTLDYQCTVKKKYSDSDVSQKYFEYNVGQIAQTFPALSTTEINNSENHHYSIAYSNTGFNDEDFAVSGDKRRFINNYCPIVTQLKNQYEYDRYIKDTGQLSEARTLDAFGPVKIEAPENTVVMIADRYKANASRMNDSTYFRHLIGPTEVLELYAKNNAESDIGITEMFFGGIHLYWASSMENLHHSIFRELVSNSLFLNDRNNGGSEIRQGDLKSKQEIPKISSTWNPNTKKWEYEYYYLPWMTNNSLIDLDMNDPEYFLAEFDAYDNKKGRLDTKYMYDMTSSYFGGNILICLDTEEDRYCVKSIWNRINRNNISEEYNFELYDTIYKSDGTSDTMTYDEKTVTAHSFKLSDFPTVFEGSADGIKTIPAIINKLTSEGKLPLYPNVVYEGIRVSFKADSIAESFTYRDSAKLVYDFSFFTDSELYCYYNEEWTCMSLLNNDYELRMSLGGDVLVTVPAIIDYFVELTTYQYDVTSSTSYTATSYN